MILSKRNRVQWRKGRAGVLCLAILLTFACQSGSDGDGPIISGIVRDADGQAIAGAVVRVESEDSGLSFLVVSKEGGDFETPRLLAGTYKAQGFGEGFESRVSDAFAVRADSAPLIDITLDIPRAIPEPETRMSLQDYARLMPEAEGREANGRELIMTRCVLCHHLDRIAPTRHNRQTWEKSVDRMVWFLNERLDLLEEFRLQPIFKQERDDMVAYLSTHNGMEVPPIPAQESDSGPNTHIPMDLFDEKFIVMEFAPPNGSGEYEIGVDAEGNAWITEGRTDRFGFFDPDSLTYTKIKVPEGSVPRVLAQIAVDPNGDVWILDNGPTPDAALLRYSTTTEEFREYPIKAPDLLRAPINTIRFLNGYVWGTGNASTRVIRLDPASGEITEYPAPKGSHPYGIAIGSDQAVWYTGNYDNAIVRIDPLTGETKTHKTQRGSGIRRMGGDAVGNMWIGAQNTGKLIKLHMESGEMSEYDVPTPNAGPYSVDVDTVHNLIWFSERDGDKLGRFDPSTESFTEFPLVHRASEARRVLVDPSNPNRVWWGCSDGGFGYIDILE